MSQPTEPTSLRRTETIINQRGLHARAAARLAETAGRFKATVSISKDGQTVAARSIMGLMMLAASPGSTIEIEAAGIDAAEALDAVSALVQNKFDEDE